MALLTFRPALAVRRRHIQHFAVPVCPFDPRLARRDSTLQYL
jgi:hypothetical protein